MRYGRPPLLLTEGVLTRMRSSVYRQFVFLGAVAIGSHPAAAQQPSRDEVVLVDGRIVTYAALGVAGAAVATDGSTARLRVIHWVISDSW